MCPILKQFWYTWTILYSFIVPYEGTVHWKRLALTWLAAGAAGNPGWPGTRPISGFKVPGTAFDPGGCLCSPPVNCAKFGRHCCPPVISDPATLLSTFSEFPAGTFAVAGGRFGSGEGSGGTIVEEGTGIGCWRFRGKLFWFALICCALTPGAFCWNLLLTTGRLLFTGPCWWLLETRAEGMGPAGTAVSGLSSGWLPIAGTLSLWLTMLFVGAAISSGIATILKSFSPEGCPANFWICCSCLCFFKGSTGLRKNSLESSFSPDRPIKLSPVTPRSSLSKT